MGEQIKIKKKDMGNVIFRNRHWYYRSVYDDYAMREMRMAFGVASFIYLPFYW